MPLKTLLPVLVFFWKLLPISCVSCLSRSHQPCRESQRKRLWNEFEAHTRSCTKIIRCHQYVQLPGAWFWNNWGTILQNALDMCRVGAWQQLSNAAYPGPYAGPYMLHILMYKDYVGAFLNHRDGCVMHQQVDVPCMKLTRFFSSRRGFGLWRREWVPLEMQESARGIGASGLPVAPS